jgi:hypothetical protein
MRNVTMIRFARHEKPDLFVEENAIVSVHGLPDLGGGEPRSIISLSNGLEYEVIGKAEEIADALTQNPPTQEILNGKLVNRT